MPNSASGLAGVIQCVDTHSTLYGKCDRSMDLSTKLEGNREQNGTRNLITMSGSGLTGHIVSIALWSEEGSLIRG